MQNNNLLITERNYYAELAILQYHALDNQNAWELADQEGPEPLASLEDALQTTLTEVQRLRIHEHRWNDEDWCIDCGRDGRA